MRLNMSLVEGLTLRRPIDVNKVGRIALWTFPHLSRVMERCFYGATLLKVLLKEFFFSFISFNCLSKCISVVCITLIFK